MKLELKNLKVHDDMSDDSLAFSAVLYVEGKKAANLLDDGNGGEIRIDSYGIPGGKELIEKASEYANALPDHQSEYGPLQMNLEFLISLMIEDIQNEKHRAKFLKAFEKHCLKGLVVTNGKRGSYSTIGWSKIPLQEMLTHSATSRENVFRTIKREVGKGDKILNKNLPEDMIQWLKDNNGLGDVNELLEKPKAKTV